MIYLRFLILLFAGFVVMPTSSNDQASTHPVSVSHAWARALPAGLPNGAAYLTLSNHGDTPISLVAASSTVADRLEFHATKHQGDTASMHAMDGIEIPPHHDVALEPGGMHLMLIGLTTPMNEGTQFTVTLTFDDGSEQDVQFPVQRDHTDHSAGGADGDMHQHDHHQTHKKHKM